MSLRGSLEALQVLLPRSRRGVVVLAYHLVGAGSDSPVDISLAEFRRQMGFLRSRCVVLSLGEALAVESDRRLQDKPVVVLTFDDAFKNFRDVAWPVLTEIGLPATLYVPVAFVTGEGKNPIRGGTFPACSWSDLRDLASEGVSMGSHTMTHTNLARATAEVVDSELRDSRDQLEQRLGVAVKSFCYPQAKWNRDIATRASRYYESAVCAGGRRFVPGRDRAHRIPRFPVRRDIGSFESMLHAPVWIPEAIADVVRQRMP